MEITQISPVVFETIGVMGFVLYVSNYALLTLRYINGHDVSYFVLNLLAAAFVLIGLMASFNLASALIQIFWVAMSLLGIALRFAKPPQDPSLN